MSQPFLFLTQSRTLALAPFRDELRQFSGFQQAFIDERLEAPAWPSLPRMI